MLMHDSVYFIIHAVCIQYSLDGSIELINFTFPEVCVRVKSSIEIDPYK